MEYEALRFRGVPNYGVRVTRPVGHPDVAVMNLTDRPRKHRLPDSTQMEGLLSYICGAGATKMVFDFQGYNPQDAAERATGVAITLKRFRIESRYVGVDMDNVPSDKGLIDVWRSNIAQRSALSIDAAVAGLLRKEK